MPRPVDQMIADILRREGGFVNHPADRGGPTNYGITQLTLAAYQGRSVVAGEVAALTEEQATGIYAEMFYEDPRLYLLPRALQPFVFDAAVHHGPGRAIRMLQDVLNQAGFGPVTRDGIAGTRTAAAADRALSKMGDLLLAALVEERRNFFLRIVAADDSQSAFLAGWLNRVAEFDPLIEETPT